MGTEGAAALLVTGAGRGIGRSVALLAATAGRPVAVWDLDEAAAETARLIGAAGGTAVHAVVDVADAPAVTAAFGEAVAVLGPIGAVVANAGPPSALEFGVAQGASVALSCMENVLEAWFSTSPPPGGAAVLVASVAGNRLGAAKPWYAAAKSGIAGYMRALAVSRPHGVRVNAVAPGLVATQRTERLARDPEGRALVARNPLGRMGEPEEIASAILFLLSTDASYVNGVLLPVDGGGTLVW